MSEIKPVGGRFFELQREVKIPDPIELAEGIVIKPPTKNQLQAFSVAETAEERESALLGADYEKIVEFYGDKPYQLWVDFQKKIQDHFFGPGADEVPGK
ncbi:hypothetical protein [Rhodococcus opacus]|uniref:Tail assembly chaperone n=1 Tax=Rhodococcus opacus TaxID=37919 RepID=A0A2S8JAZ3_RHOOP|nr:hypothetical protein [Rhodococcus opacus]PQP24165.1 hypothetical protein C5613_14895 [Rhodococcus opacus]